MLLLNLIHIYHCYLMKKMKKKDVLLSLIIISVWNKERSKGGGEGRRRWGGRGGVPNTQLKDKTMALLNSLKLKCIPLWIARCHFHVKQDLIPLSFLWPRISMRWKYFSTVSLDSGLFSPDIHHALKSLLFNHDFLSNLSPLPKIRDDIWARNTTINWSGR